MASDLSTRLFLPLDLSALENSPSRQGVTGPGKNKKLIAQSNQIDGQAASSQSQGPEARRHPTSRSNLPQSQVSARTREFWATQYSSGSRATLPTAAASTLLTRHVPALQGQQKKKKGPCQRRQHLWPQVWPQAARRLFRRRSRRGRCLTRTRTRARVRKRQKRENEVLEDGGRCHFG